MRHPNARARSLAYSLVAVPMLRLPDEAMLAEISSPAFAAELAEIEGAFDDPAMAKALSRLRDFADTCVSRNPDALLAELGRDRTYLLRALAPGVGAPPAYESHWQGPDSAKTVMLDLAQSYRSAGIELSAQAHERPDYLGVELLFLGELAAQELEGNTDATKLQAQQERFFAQHIEPWAAGYLQEALPLAQTAFFRGVLEVALALVNAEGARFKATAAAA